MPGIIDVSQLVKTYGDGTKAVKGITFSVNEGEFFGFLGTNGAGKSTTIKILTTLLQKTSFFFSSRRRHTRFDCDWSSDVCSSDLPILQPVVQDDEHVLAV